MSNLNETKENPELFDIFKVNFVYQENLLDPTKGNKNRPALIVRITNSVILPYDFAMITGESSGSDDYEILDWKEAGLDKPSYIRFLRTASFDKSVLDNAEYYGKLTDRDVQRIKSMKLIKL